MAKQFLGRGWKFPVKLDSLAGTVETSAYEEDIREAIWIILSTSKGERLMRPDFGCGIHEFMFAVIDTTTLRLIETSVREALTKWEARIEKVNIKASPDPVEGGRVFINIDYTVRSTNNRFNLVYPFYLKEA